MEHKGAVRREDRKNGITTHAWDEYHRVNWKEARVVTVEPEEKDVGSTEDTEHWKHEQSGLRTHIGPHVAAIPISNKKPVKTPQSSRSQTPPTYFTNCIHYSTCKYLYSGTCTMLLIAGEGPRTETSDSIKLLIHATTS